MSIGLIAVKHFFNHILLGIEPYEAEVLTFNDKLKIKFRTLSVADNHIVLLQQRYDKDANIVKTDDDYTIRVIQYRLAASLVSINDVPFCPDITAEIPSAPNTTYLVKRVDTMEPWPIFKLSTITDAFNKFEVRVMALTEESFKESF